MIGKIVIFSFLCGIALSDSRANQFIDNVLQTRLPQALHSAALAPARLSDFRSTFGVQDVYGNIGEALYSRGNASHFDRVRRHGDCSGPRMAGGEITVNCTIALQQIITEYKVIIRNGSMVYLPRNMGHVSETLVSFIVSGRSHNNYQGTIRNFKIDRIGAITPTYSGLPAPLNRYLKVIQDSYRTHVTAELKSILQIKFPAALSMSMSNLPMPRP